MRRLDKPWGDMVQQDLEPHYYKAGASFDHCFAAGGKYNQIRI